MTSLQEVIHTCYKPLQLIHSDVWQSPVPSNTGFRYYVLFVDDFTHFTWLFPMKHKSTITHHFLQFQKLVENQFDCKIKAFQSDGGLEFDNSPLKRHFQDCGILFHKSCPGILEQNGVAEQKHRHLIEMSRTFLVVADMPKDYWVDTVFT